jgi:hypothetical protein
MSTRRNTTAVPNRRIPTEALRTNTPNTSINSAQIFNGQSANGRLAGQHAAFAQQQLQQQQYAQNSASLQNDNSELPTRMTIAQAITLITLRLGKVETHIYELLYNQQEMGLNGGISETGDVVMIEKGVLNSILSRLDALETKTESSQGNTPSTAEFTILKQNVESLKPALVQTKTALTNTAKETKKQIMLFRSELNETRDALAALHALTMENNQAILMMGVNTDILEDSEELITDENGTLLEETPLEESNIEGEREEEEREEEEISKENNSSELSSMEDTTLITSLSNKSSVFLGNEISFSNVASI